MIHPREPTTRCSCATWPDLAGRRYWPLRSISEDHAAETVQREGKIDAADRSHRDKPRPDDREVGAAIENGLREGNEVWRRADDPHDMLEPDRHALHRRCAAGQELHDDENWNCKQSDMSHGRGFRPEQDAEGGDGKGVKRASRQKKAQRARDRNLEPPLDHEGK